MGTGVEQCGAAEHRHVWGERDKGAKREVTKGDGEPFLPPFRTGKAKRMVHDNPIPPFILLRVPAG